MIVRFGFHPLFSSSAEPARRFHQGAFAARRIRRAVDPRVVMVAVDDPLVGKLASLDAHDDVVKRPVLPVECELEVDLRRPGADVIRDRQRAAPASGATGPFRLRSSGSASP